jgi:hypothetical protein
MAQNFMQDGDCSMQLSFIDYHEVDNLQIDFDEMADGSNVLILL